MDNNLLNISQNYKNTTILGENGKEYDTYKPQKP